MTDGSIATDIDQAELVSEDGANVGLSSPYTEEAPDRRDSNTDSSLIETPVISRQSSTTAIRARPTAEPLYASPITDKIIEEIPPTPQNENDHVSPDDRTSFSRPASSLSLRPPSALSLRPGVSLRIRPKRLTASHSGTNGDSLHNLFITGSSIDEEKHLSRSASQSSLGSELTAETRIGARPMTSDGCEKRTSTMSAMTVAFGSLA